MISAPPGDPPIFVYGALRSGTTVFRLMLNAHDRLSNPGEADFLFDALLPDRSHPTGWRYDLEILKHDRFVKLLNMTISETLDGLDLLQNLIEQLRCRAPGRVLSVNVHRHADRIAEIYPQARFVHLLRDPRDVARSSVGMGWVGISYFGLDHWLRSERAWDTAKIAPECVMRLRFEDLMSDLETQLTRTCRFMGVPFESRMLNYHQNSSYAPPNPNLCEQWRRASPYEIALLEGKCGRLLRARGYKPSNTPRYPGKVEFLNLKFQNTVLRWRSSIRRYGLPLLVAAKVSGWVGARKTHRTMRQRMADIVTENLK